MSVAASTVVLRLDFETQRRLVEQVRQVVKRSPLIRPRTPNGLPVRVRVSAAGELGWVGDGKYRYDATDSRGRPWPAMPTEWRQIADRCVSLDPRHDGRFVKWDSAIINWYEPGSSLGWHVDRSEADTTLPIVTVCLGDAASLAIKVDGGEADRTRLESGDVFVFAGPLRNCEHTIERIIPAELFSPLKARGRISVTIRQAGRAELSEP